MNKRKYITLLLAFCYALILGHNLIPHVHHSHSEEHHHEHTESFLDKLLTNHEHSGDLGHEQVELYSLADNDLDVITPLILPALLPLTLNCVVCTGLPSSNTIREQQNDISPSLVVYKSPPISNYSLRGPPLA